MPDINEKIKSGATFLKDKDYAVFKEIQGANEKLEQLIEEVKKKSEETLEIAIDPEEIRGPQGIPGIPGAPGKDAVLPPDLKEEIFLDVLSQMPTPEELKGLPGSNGSPDTGEEIIAKINDMSPDGLKIDAAHISNLPRSVERIIETGGFHAGAFETPIISGDTTTLIVRKDAQGKWVLTVPTNVGASVDLTTEVTGILPIANGGTNNSTAYAAGSVIYSDGAKLTEDSSGLYYDSAGKRLSIGYGLSPASSTWGYPTSAFTPATLYVNALATASRAEVMAVMKVSDADSVLVFANQTTTGADFAPSIAFRNIGTNAAADFNIASEMLPALDTGSVAAFRFTAFTRDASNNFATLSSRPIFTVANLSTYLMTVTAAGNLGLGITDTTFGSVVGSRLSVSTADGGTLITGGNATTPRFALNGNSNGSWTMYDYAAGGFTAGITQKSGLVGIGVSSPGRSLSTSGAIGVTAGATGDKVIFYEDSSGSGTNKYAVKVNANELQFYTSNSSDIISLYPNNTLTLVAKNGSVGIGTTTPGALLDIGSAGSLLGTLRLEGNTSGYVQLQPAAAAGSVIFTLPAAQPTIAGQALVATTGGVMSWSNVLPTATTVSLTAQTADIGSTNFSNTSTAGLYRVSYTLEDTAADLTAGAVTVTIAYTDTAGAATQASAAQVLTGVGRVQGSVFIQLASGSISYSTTHTGLFGTATYALYMTVEKLL